MKFSARNAWGVILAVMFVTMGSVAVLLVVEPNVETDIQAGYFGTSDHQANMFRELREKVAGVNSEIVYFELKDFAQGPDNSPITNVTSLEALRAQEELFNFVKKEFKVRTGEDKIISHTSLPYFVKLIYAQYPNGDFVLPGTELETQTAVALLQQADTAGATKLYHSEDFRAAVMFIIYDPDTSVISKKETGGIINEIIADYREMGASPGSDKVYDIWQAPYLDSWGVQSWIYRIDEQVQKESVIFIGAVFAFLSGTLLLLFRNLKRAAIGVITVAIILLWTLAGMTIGNVSIGFVSMAMFPLLLGVGVDYVIHIINEFGVERAETGSSEEAFELIGKRGAVALLISTLTTISGFVVMTMSTSPMIVEISVATIFGISTVFLLSITWLPALLQLSVRNEAKEVMRASEAIGSISSFVGRNKAVTIVVLLAGTIFLGSYIPDTEYVVGTVEVNLPQKEIWTHKEDRAHMLDMYQRFQERIKAVAQETVIQRAEEGSSMATVGALEDMISVHKAMQAEPFVQSAGGAVNSVPSILALYETLKDGLQSAGPTLLEPILQGGAGVPCIPTAEICYPGLAGDSYDDQFGMLDYSSDEEVRATYDAMLASPMWEPLLLTFMDKDYTIAWALTFINIEPVDGKAAERADEAFKGAVERANTKHTDTTYFGTLTGIEKYNDYTNKWLTISSVASLSVVAVLVAIFTRSVRAVFAVLTPMVLTFIWWLGALPTPAVDIDLAFIFMIPIAFITSLGSDYAVHLVYNLEQSSNPKFIFKTVGKAVVYSSFTTIVSFFIFTRGAIRGSYEMFEAAVIAIALMTFLTMMTIPLFYYRRDGSRLGKVRDGHE